MSGVPEGWTLPGYELVGVLGHGGFSTVYRARQLSLGREVALKVLNASLAGPGDRRRFDNERHTLGLLSGHPHIVDVFDAGLTGEGRPYLVMRLYASSLADAVRLRERLAPTEACTMTAAVAEALDFAHSRRAIHRDIKPANVLLDVHGRPALTDFGIVKILDPTLDDPAATGQPQGSTTFWTYSYVAPEILRGASASVASDVYALAATLYEMLTGAPPFAPRTPAELLAVLDGPPPPITVPEVPAALADVVVAALAKDPGDRPATAGAFAAAATAALAAPKTRPTATPVGDVPDDPTVLRPPVPRTGPPVPPLPSPGQPSPGQRTTGQRTTGQPWPPLRVLTGGTGMLYGQNDTTVTCHAWHPIAQEIATGTIAGTVRIWDAATGDLRGTFGPHRGQVNTLAWSPDARVLAAGTLGGPVLLWDVASARVVRTFEGHSRLPHCTRTLAWSPDGRLLAVASDRRPVSVYDAVTGRVVATLGLQTVGASSVHFSPVTPRLVVHRGQAEVWRVEPAHPLATLGRPRTPQRVGAASDRAPAVDTRSVTFAPDGFRVAVVDDPWAPLVTVWGPAPTGGGREGPYQVLGVLRGHAVAPGPVQWQPAGGALATGAGDGTARVWDASTGVERRLLRHPPASAGSGGVRDLHLHPGGYRPAPPTVPRDVRVRCLGWAPDGPVLATGTDDGVVRLWDTTSGRELQALTGARLIGGEELSWSARGRYLAVPSVSDGEIRLIVWGPDPWS